MKIFCWLIVGHMLVGCSTTPPAPEVPMVSVETTLEHIRQSYILGCAEAMKGMGKTSFYPDCRDKGIKHSDAVRNFISTPAEVK